MYRLPHITPLDNLVQSTNILADILKYKQNNWAIGQLYPSGGPDSFTYFFSIRNIPIYNYLRGTISMGNPSAYDKNYLALSKYINCMIHTELSMCNKVICDIYKYQAKSWSIGEAYPDGGPDDFVVFFAQRNLPIKPFLFGTVIIGSPSSYAENIQTLTQYKNLISSYCIGTDGLPA